MRPIQYMNLSTSSAIGMLVGTWTLIIVLCLPPLLVPAQAINFEHCRSNLHETSLLVYTALSGFFVPLAVIVACYVRIFVELYRKMARKERRKRQEFELASGGCGGGGRAASTKVGGKSVKIQESATVTKDVNSNGQDPQVSASLFLVVGSEKQRKYF